MEDGIKIEKKNGVVSEKIKKKKDPPCVYHIIHVVYTVYTMACTNT